MGANSVLTSLDEQNGPGFAYGLFAYSVETDPTVSGGFTMQRATVTDATLASTVSAMAAKGVVVTAASVNSAAGIDLVAYGWSGDQGTTYDSQTVLTPYVNLGPQALSLAQQGYIITAVGTADANQMLLVERKCIAILCRATSPILVLKGPAAPRRMARLSSGTSLATTRGTTRPPSRSYWLSRSALLRIGATPWMNVKTGTGLVAPVFVFGVRGV